MGGREGGREGEIEKAREDPWDSGSPFANSSTFKNSITNSRFVQCADYAYKYTRVTDLVHTCDICAVSA